MTLLSARKTKLKAETSGRYRGRPLSIELTPYVVKIWPKGTRTQMQIITWEAIHDLGMKLTARAALAEKLATKPRRRRI